MKAKLTINNSESISTIIFENIKDNKFFSTTIGEETYSVDLKVDFIIKMESKDHNTIVTIKRKAESNIEVIDDNGSILLPINVLAIKENNGMISLVYKLDDKENSINIEYM